VKPGNLLLREDGALKITDFGIARAVEATQLTQVGSVLGTAAYLSPEQAAGERVTAATDIYGLGVVLYELLTGRTPYVIESLAALVALHRESSVTPVREREPTVPEALEAAVMKCLARNPDYRPASAAALAHELAAASPEPPTVPLPPTSGVRATDVATVPLASPEAPFPSERRPAGRSRKASAAAAFVALALAAAAAGFWVAGGGQDPDPAPAEQSQRPRVEPVPASDDPAALARNLAAWLRDRAG
jgi:serine/threonine-protein kinase